MTAPELNELGLLIRSQADTVLTTWRNEVRKLPAAQHLSTPTLNDHIPDLIEELADAFEMRSEDSITDMLAEGTPPEHGEQRVADGFDVVEVVAEYNILRGCIHDLAMAHGMRLDGNAFHILNRVLDGAIGLAVEAFAAQQAREVKRRREEYLAFVAHDLRTPLNAISVATAILEADLKACPDLVGMIGILRRNVRQLGSLVNKVMEENTNLLTADGIRPELRRFDLWPLVESLVHDLKPMDGNGSVVLMNQIPVDLEVHGDAELIRRILQNLISNALTYTTQGTVQIGSRLRIDEGSVECWVSDTGKGIPAHLLGQVFQKGEGDAERTASSGLGLAIVKRFVEAHKGAVHAESEVGKGTTIRFTLPIKAQA